MMIHTRKGKFCFRFRLLAALVSVFYLTTMIVGPAPARAEVFINNLPIPGTMVTFSPAYMPTLIKGIKVFPDNPLRFDFIIDKGDSMLSGNELKDESYKLIKYFLASLTVPDDDLWVNLSPYEKERIVPEGFGITEMGRDLLAQDYLLKQITASVLYPEEELGKEFWKKVYDKVYKIYKTTNIPINTFNKVWIVPQKAIVYKNGNTAFVLESHLKVMLEQDYLALEKNLTNKEHGMNRLETKDVQGLSSVSSEIVRELILPEIEKEVNEGKNFAALRQIYSSVILATWYKRNLKESLLGKIYVGKNKVSGVDVEDRNVKEKIYQQYLKAFKEGVYNYIRKDYDQGTQQMIPRKYFSGGVELGLSSMNLGANVYVGSPGTELEFAL